MLWNRKQYSLQLSHGEGHILSDTMYGMIQHLIVMPKNRETIWSMVIKDSYGDAIYMVYDHEGRLDDKEGIPVGSSKAEQLRVEIFDTTSNEEFNLIFKVREAL